VIGDAVNFEDLMIQLLDEREAKHGIVESFIAADTSAMKETYQQAYARFNDAVDAFRNARTPEARRQEGMHLALCAMPQFKALLAVASGDPRLEGKVHQYKGALELVQEEQLKQWLLLEDTDVHATLMSLIVRGATEMATALIKRCRRRGISLDLNQSNAEGFTPLHYAYMRRDLAMIQFLTKQGASHEVKNHKQEEPWDMMLWDYEACRAKLIACIGTDSDFPSQDAFDNCWDDCFWFDRGQKKSSVEPEKAFVMPYSMFTSQFRLPKKRLEEQHTHYRNTIMEPCEGDKLDATLRDWNRPSTIQIAGESLKGENGQKMPDGYFDDLDDVKAFFKTHLTQPLNGLTGAKQEALLHVCLKTLHQSGVMYPAFGVCVESFKHLLDQHPFVFSVPNKSVNITPVADENALYLHEVERGFIVLMDEDNKRCYFSMETVLKLTVSDNLEPQLEVVDFRVTSHGSLSFFHLDERTLFEKLIDFLKTLFGMQAVHARSDVLQHGPS
jgi:hypothetical protein